MIAIVLLGATAFTPGVLPGMVRGRDSAGAVAVPRGAPLRMAGFGGAAAAPKKSKPTKPVGKAASKAAHKASRATALSARRQWEYHSELLKSGGATTCVWARPAEAEDGTEWIEVGSISAKGASDLAAAAHAQKRLILEHAGRVSPKLLVLKRLECGFGDDVASVSAVAKGPAPEGATSDYGLVGLPDPGGFYMKGAGDLRSGATASSGAAPASDSKGRVK